MQNKRDGWFVTIPEDDRCFLDESKLKVPELDREGPFHILNLRKITPNWHSAYIFLGFREVL